MVTVTSDPRVLAPYAGRIPPRPEWFESALAVPFEDLRCTHDGIELEVLAWGDPSAQPLLLLHGNRAHARWWSPIAGLLASRYRVATLSWSGMGASGWRDAYSSEIHAGEALAAARAAGLFDHGKPVVAAHSFGVGPGLVLARDHADEIRGLIMLDSMLVRGQEKVEVKQSPVHRVSPTIADALVRFRLAPPQDCANHYYVDWIARNALQPAPDGSGWVWSFDPLHWERYEWFDKWTAANQAAAPLALVLGERSMVYSDDYVASIAADLPPGTEIATLADAAHHLMLDQPLAFAETIDRIAAGMHGAAKAHS